MNIYCVIMLLKVLLFLNKKFVFFVLFNFTMSDNSDFPLDFSALMASRLCHDLISPVGALVNGLELLEDGGAEDMREFAMDLISKSANSASIKLKFARLAFGASGSAGNELDLQEAHEIADAYMSNEKPNLVWHGEPRLMSKNKVKLLLNLILISIACVPRGGTITVTISPEDLFTIECVGEKAKLPDEFAKQLSSPPTADELSPHIIQFYHTILLSQSVGVTIATETSDDKIILSTHP